MRRIALRLFVAIALCGTAVACGGAVAPVQPDAGCAGVQCGGACCAQDQTCDSATQKCVDSVCSVACSGETPVCDLAGTGCVCSDTSCGAGKSCVEGSCQAGNACDPACSGQTPFCNPASLACECTDSSCPSGQACVNGTCQTGGTCAPACAGATPFCDPASNTCVCTDASCGTGKSCQPTLRQCVDDGPCSPACSGATPNCDVVTSTCVCDSGSCTGGQICSASGECADSLCSPACSGATPDCDDATTKCVCNASSCKAGQTCDATGKCVASTCTPACSGATPHCNTSKNTCECTASSCAAGAVCSSGACAQGTSFTMAQILDAANRTSTFIAANKRLPNYVTIGADQVTMPSFLHAMVAAVLELDAGKSDAIVYKTFSAPTSPKDNTVQGDVQKAEYLKIAGDVKSYMDSSGKAPDYATPTSLGTYMSFTNLVYMYGKILDFYKTNTRLPNYVTLTLFSTALVSGIVQQLRTALGGSFSNATEMYALFKNKNYKFYENDVYTQAQEITRLTNNSGINCVDSSQIGHAGIDGLNQMGKNYTVDYVHADFPCGGHVFLRIKGEEFGSSYVYFDLAGAEKWHYNIGTLMCHGPMTNVRYNEAWIVSDDGKT